MIRSFFLAAALLCCAVTASAQSDSSALRSLESRQDTQGWEAVGRLDVIDGGFCTAALIRDRLLLTAAHCVYDEHDQLLPANRFVFQAGLRNGRADATRRVSRVVVHPDYVSDGPTAKFSAIANDIAVLELVQPIRYSGVQPFPVSARPLRGDKVSIVSYGRSRSEAPSLEESCSVLSRLSGTVVMDCDIEFGSSGSPVFSVRNGRAQIVSVVSSSGQSGGKAVAIGTSLQEPLQILLAEFAARGPARPGGEQRLMNTQERNDTGAKFISSGG